MEGSSGVLAIAGFLLAAAAAGGLAGVAMGALAAIRGGAGAGGGVVLTIALHPMLQEAGARPETALHLALGVALAANAALSLRAALARRAQGVLDGREALLWGAPCAAGAALAAVALALAGPAWTAGLVGGALLAAGLRLIFDDGRPLRLGGPAFRLAGGVAIGALTVASGGAAGAYLAPALRWRGAEASQAAALAAAVGAPCALIGAAALALQGPETRAPFAVGAVDFAAAAAAAVAAGAASPLGVRLAQEAPALIIRAVAALTICASGLALLRLGTTGE
jgi:uncharacterized membrane protein YfcA